MATGLLVLGLGRATRLLRFLGDLRKTYEGTLRLGVETDTLDADGAVTRESTVAVADDEVARVMTAKLGESSQRPPAFSAVKVGGRKLYDAARRGEMLRAEPRTVRVDRFDLIARNGVDVDFVAVVSGGTYIRVLAADVGSALGCGAYLTRLRRTAIGSFAVEDASPPDGPETFCPSNGPSRIFPAWSSSRRRRGSRGTGASWGRPGSSDRTRCSIRRGRCSGSIRTTVPRRAPRWCSPDRSRLGRCRNLGPVPDSPGSGSSGT